MRADETTRVLDVVDSDEQVVLQAFDTPQTLYQIIVEVEEPEVSRT